MAYQFYINSLGKEQGGGCVAEVVDSEVGEVICFEEFLEAVVNIAWFAWAAIFVAEDKVIIIVALAKEDAVFVLPEFHAVQGVGDKEQGTPVSWESPLGYHSFNARILT